MFKKVRVEKAVGMILAHDITRIVPGVKKGPLFRKGHIVTEKDIPELLSCGKEHLYLWERRPGWIHENEAATRLAAAAVGHAYGLSISVPKEGKVNISVTANGLLKVDTKKLTYLNCLGELVMATAHTNTPVRRGDIVAGTRIIPLVIKEEKIGEAELLCNDGKPLVTVKPFRSCSTGIIVTGGEVKMGRIRDSFGPVVKKKLSAFNAKIADLLYAGDDYVDISRNIRLLAENCDLVIVTGGMSVDPDDVTPRAIKETGAKVVGYGVPVLPGSMFLLAYLNNKPVMGLPGCVMYERVTIFDLVLPRILAGERISTADLAVLGHGGLCLNCPVCRYPHCSFGKGAEAVN